MPERDEHLFGINKLKLPLAFTTPQVRVLAIHRLGRNDEICVEATIETTKMVEDNGLTP